MLRPIPLLFHFSIKKWESDFHTGASAVAHIFVAATTILPGHQPNAFTTNYVLYQPKRTKFISFSVV